MKVWTDYQLQESTVLYFSLTYGYNHQIKSNQKCIHVFSILMFNVPLTAPLSCLSSTVSIVIPSNSDHFQMWS